MYTFIEKKCLKWQKFSLRKNPYSGKLSMEKKYLIENIIDNFKRIIVVKDDIKHWFLLNKNSLDL